MQDFCNASSIHLAPGKCPTGRRMGVALKVLEEFEVPYTILIPEIRDHDIGSCSGFFVDFFCIA